MIRLHLVSEIVLCAMPILTESSCNDVGDCVTECREKCGCDKAYIYNATADACVVNSEYLKNIMLETNNLSERIRDEAETVFQGITIAVFIFIACAFISTLAACVFCCHINYSDRKLKKEVNLLNKKAGNDKIQSVKSRNVTQPHQQSCNVIVEDAGLFVV